MAIPGFQPPTEIDWEREYGLKMKDKAEKHKDQVFQILEQQMGKDDELNEDEGDDDYNQDQEEIFDIQTDGF